MALGLQLLRCNHPATHLPDEKTGRGLGTKQAAGSAALASDPQPRGRRHLPLCPSSSSFLCWRGEGSRKETFSPPPCSSDSVSVRLWCGGWRGGVAPAGAISGRGSPARKQRALLAQRCPSPGESRSARASCPASPLDPSHSGPPRCFGDRKAACECWCDSGAVGRCGEGQAGRARR